MNTDEFSDDLPEGTLLGDRFEIIKLVGRGASSSVYEAKHLMLDRTVAVKIIKRELLETEKAVLRFTRESALLNTFDHPNIVRCYAFGQTQDGRFFMVQEFLDGSTLQEIINSEKFLSPERASRIVREICHGLGYAHEKNIVHRDIKPANIMLVNLNGVETAKILDFGIYKDFTPSCQQGLTTSGNIVGTFNYASPEQCKNDTVDGRSDIYSLGCVYYEMLCGVPPFEGANPLSTIDNQINQQLKAVPAHDGISSDLEKIILKCLNKSPTARFQSTEELSDAIGSAKIASASKGVAKKRLTLPAVAITLVILCACAFACFIRKPPFQKKMDIPNQILKYRDSSTRPIIRRDKYSSAEEYVARADEWLDYQKNKAKIDDLGNTWANSKSVHSNLALTTEPPAEATIEKRFEFEIENSLRKNDISTTMRLLDAFTQFSSASKKFEAVEKLLAKVPTENNYLKSQLLGMKLRMIKAGEKGDLLALTKQRLQIDEQLDKRDNRAEDYIILSRIFLEKGQLAQGIQYARKAQYYCENEIDADVLNDASKLNKLQGLNLHSRLLLINAYLKESKLIEARKVLSEYNELVKLYRRNDDLRIIAALASALKLAEDRDWVEPTRQAARLSSTQPAMAALIFFKHAEYFVNKEKYDEALKELDKVRPLIKISASGTRDKQPTPEDIMSSLGEFRKLAITADYLTALALISTDKLEESKPYLAACEKNFSKDRILSIEVKDLQAFILRKENLEEAISQHKELLELSSLQESQPYLKEITIHLVQELMMKREIDQAKKLLIATKAAAKDPQAKKAFQAILLKLNTTKS